MKKISVIYWSGTGHTEKMAQALVEGIEKEGSEAKLLQVSQASLDDVKNADAVAFGCPAMGSEELEEEEMRPFIDQSKEVIRGKKILLFGSYEWAEGQWMKDWAEEMKEAGADLLEAEGFIAYDDPDEDALDDLRMLGKDLARA